MPEAAPEARVRRGLVWLWLALAVLVSDQLSKLWVMRAIEPYRAVEVTAFFNLVHVHNPGAAFSLLADQAGWQRLLFIAVAVVASALIVYFLHKPCPGRRFCLALALILGGAIGNLVDRLVHGHVIDFLDFHLAGWHWPAFNVADSAITVGAVLLILDSVFSARSSASDRRS